MSLLVPDYSSSSEEDEAQPAVRPPQPSAPAPSTSQPPAPSSIASLELPPPTTATKAIKRRRVAKKPKTALFLHPDIQRLLESGSSRGLGESDSDDDDIAGGGESLLAKQKKAVAAKRPRAQPRGGANGAAELSSGLSFLPPPKHAIEEKKSKQSSVVSAAAAAITVEEETATTAPEEYSEQTAATYDAAATTAQYQQYYEQQGYYDPSQYQYEQQQQWQEQNQYPAFYQGEDETFGSSKRARNRDRDLERALQQGHFQSVASKIIEVQGPAPNAWAPPVDSLSSGGDKDASDVKVQASFWNSQAGAKVATAKPNRMQRQKHQLNQLAFDAKLREHELMDKKGVSLKTKAETHAKYGW
ncbi:hypothetical protein Gpo141_00007175 [Globisporangium polare]